MKVGSFLKLWKGKSRVGEGEKVESERRKSGVREKLEREERFRKVKEGNDDPFSSLRCVFSRSEDGRMENGKSYHLLILVLLLSFRGKKGKGVRGEERETEGERIPTRSEFVLFFLLHPFRVLS